MVGAAAASDRILLDRAQARMGLARIDDPGASAANRINVSMRRGRDSRHQLDEVERGALADQQSSEAPLDVRDNVAIRELRTLLRERGDFRRRAGEAENAFEQDAAA